MDVSLRTSNIAAPAALGQCSGRLTDQSALYSGSRPALLASLLFFGDVNMFLILFLALFSTLATNTNTSLHLLLTAELL